ncbi:prolyl oligopeptidase [Thermonema lapsum]|uniref:prolyl oligopeptidase n=1 Tax=Thermonema lapsum TaxID=28195 RepID=A0A846MU24_9BACT|nr:prolyl oligopeptidase family serine peptidase [Thermonema lapsum]NIK74832.1 prolyl oligopeptidase [Thermonema lapsum]
MKKYIYWLGCLFLGACQTQETTQNSMEKLIYPETPTVQQLDNYFGTTVADPYRWLENTDSAAVQAWIAAQNKLTFSYLEKIPFRESIKKRLEEVWNFERMSAPLLKGGYYYYTKNDGLQNQSVIYRREGINGTEEVVLDPNTLSDDGTVAVGNWSISNDGRYFAYSTSAGGSDWQEIKIIDLQTKKTLDDHLRWVKFSGISWYRDGFFYSRYDAPPKGKEYEAKNEYHKVYYHKVGTRQSDDQLVYEDPGRPLQNFYTQTTDDEQYLFIHMPEGTGGNAIWWRPLAQPQAAFKPLINTTEYENSIVGTLNNKILLLTNAGAPKYRLVLVDPRKPEPAQWKTIIPEPKEEVLSSVSHVGGRLIAIFMKDASHRVRVYNINGEFENEIQLPTLGTVSGFDGKEEDKETFFVFNSYLYPPTVYRYDIKTRQVEEFFRPKTTFDSKQYQTREVFYKSKDGTSVHMFLTHKKGLKKDGNNPVYLYGYGGFNISLLPSFDPRILPFLEAGGIYAVANLRGGGEYGEEWHKAGMLENKQNVFDDFIAAAEYLIQEKYTSPKKIAISGRSNGGLLVGACMTQRPDLFQVALPGVGVLDMLRFHKFTIGWAWVNEYGSSEDSTQFQYLIKYSPVHNVKEADYPATLVYTAEYDDRVVPIHSFKFVAALQAHQKGERPILIRIDTKAGHGAGKPVSKLIEEWTDIWAFTFYNLNMTFPTQQ